MGLYIETPNPIGKLDYIAQKVGMFEVLPPSREKDLDFNFDLPFGYLPVCIFHNGAFEAALVCVDQREYDRTNADPSDTRPRIYILLRVEDLKKLLPVEQHGQLKLTGNKFLPSLPWDID